METVLFYLGNVGAETLQSVPLVGRWLTNWLFAGTTLSATSRQTAFQYHYAVVAVGVVGGVVVGQAVVNGRS